jgi:hypothetical protein
MRTLIILHGMSAALAIASILHLIVLIPKRRFPPRGAAVGCFICLLALYILGWTAYPVFRTQIRFDLIRDPERMWLANVFDVKEFLSVGALFTGLGISAVAMTRPRWNPGQLRALMGGLYFVLAVLIFNTVVGMILANYKTL